ncbi:MAG: chromate resistance protein ChrB domain-containing protein [Acidobacteriota bacterium]
MAAARDQTVSRPSSAPSTDLENFMDTAQLAPPAFVAPNELYRLLGGPRCPLILDVRKTPAFAEDDRMLPGALRVAPEAIAGWSAPTHAQALVAYCVHGHEVSQQAVAALARRGFHATYLEGGIALWREMGMPLLQKVPRFGVPNDAPSRWVTRERPKIDRIACPWLIRRFVDPRAEFLYVPKGAVFSVAESEGAIAYDIPGAPLEHDGEACSFDAFLRAFDLHDPALDDLAVIVRGADTGRPQLAPQAPGLLAISLGLSHNFPDDHAMLEHGMAVYDALYAWCRHVRDERHNWVPQTMLA